MSQNQKQSGSNANQGYDRSSGSVNNNPGPGTSSHNTSGNAGQSRNSIIKEGWGSRTNFQASYGLKMTPEDIEEGNAILDSMLEQDRRG